MTEVHRKPRGGKYLKALLLGGVSVGAVQAGCFWSAPTIAERAKAAAQKKKVVKRGRK